MANSQRFLSLDVLRGITVASMIFVNNGLGTSFSPLIHSHWNGLTLSDLVFPFFLFMVGVSISISLSRHASEPGMIKKILKRTSLMFIIGVALHAWDMIISGDASEIPTRLRIWGVLQRIAFSYCFAALFFIVFKGRHLWSCIISLLILYSIILIIGNGYSEYGPTNLIGRIDRVLFGKHLYHRLLKGTTPVDPEGLVGIIAGVAHTLLGVVCGRTLISDGNDITHRVMKLMQIAFCIGFIGYLISFGFPLNKRIWSPSYTLVTCSMAAGLLGLFTYFIDIKGHRDWCHIFQMFGMNALGIYVISEMIPSVFNQTGISAWLEEFWLDTLSFTIPEIASLCYALTYVSIMALLAWFLYKKKIYIKI